MHTLPFVFKELVHKLPKIPISLIAGSALVQMIVIYILRRTSQRLKQFHLRSINTVSCAQSIFRWEKWCATTVRPWRSSSLLWQLPWPSSRCRVGAANNFQVHIGSSMQYVRRWPGFSWLKNICTEMYQFHVEISVSNDANPEPRTRERVCSLSIPFLDLLTARR